jgi:tRNA(Ile)-lysidine synthase
MHATLQQRVSSYVRSRSLLHAGDRVAVAVSGGADSVGLLRLVLELRDELGIVVSVAHFHHGIRGAEADADEAFVVALSESLGLQLYLDRGDARQRSKDKKISLETAARELRHQFFTKLLDGGVVDRIATAHTLDDQAETVLMKTLRGAGTRGLSGIFPEQRLAQGSIVRPLLEVRREEVRDYLRSTCQSWREDATNADVSFTRNRMRARVLPMLRADVNPSVDLSLSHLAEIARAEEEYWQEELKKALPLVVVAGEPARGGGRKQTSAETIALDLHKLEQQPLAMRRRLLRAAAEQLGCHLDFEHVQSIFDLLSERSTRGAHSRTIELASGWRARLLFRELRLERRLGEQAPLNYRHRLPVPGEVHVSELGTTIRARVGDENGSEKKAAYNRAHSIRLPQVSELIVRNWRAGDRFQPALHKSEKRLKELLYTLHLSPGEKQIWPVVAAGDRVLWVRGIEAPELLTEDGQRLWIEEASE